MSKINYQYSWYHMYTHPECCLYTCTESRCAPRLLILDLGLLSGHSRTTPGDPTWTWHGNSRYGYTGSPYGLPTALHWTRIQMTSIENCAMEHLLYSLYTYMKFLSFLGTCETIFKSKCHIHCCQNTNLTRTIQHKASLSSLTIGLDNCL